LLEFALVAPIFFFILYALVVFGMALALKQSVTNAAAEGARSAIGSSDPVATATATVTQRLSWLSSSQKASLTITPTVSQCVGITGSSCITVQVSYPYDDNPLVPSAPIIKQIQPKVVGSTATVRLS